MLTEDHELFIRDQPRLLRQSLSAARYALAEAFGLSTLLSGFLSAMWGKRFFISAASGAIGSSQVFSVGVPWGHRGFMGVCDTESILFCLGLVYPILTGSRTVDWRQNLYRDRSLVDSVRYQPFAVSVSAFHPVFGRTIP